MKRFGVKMALLALALLLAAPVTVGAKVLPPGSYRHSCKACYVDNGWLSCRCKGDGRWHNSSIRYTRCSGDITNRDGYLTCGGSSRYALPQGSWRQSCRNARVDGDTLLAECKNGRGDWVQSWLSLRNCNRQVNNRDGRLVCGGGRSYRIPGGPWRNSCRRWRVEGERMWAECRRRNGDWHGTWVNIRDCRTLTNNNGRLRCVDR